MRYIQEMEISDSQIWILIVSEKISLELDLVNTSERKEITKRLSQLVT